MINKSKITLADKSISAFKQYLWEMGINAAEFARITGQPPATVYDWARGEYDPPPVAIWGIENYLELKRIKNEKNI